MTQVYTAVNQNPHLGYVPPHLGYVPPLRSDTNILEWSIYCSSHSRGYILNLRSLLKIHILLAGRGEGEDTNIIKSLNKMHPKIPAPFVIIHITSLHRLTCLCGCNIHQQDSLQCLCCKIPESSKKGQPHSITIFSDFWKVLVTSYSHFDFGCGIVQIIFCVFFCCILVLI